MIHISNHAAVGAGYMIAAGASFALVNIAVQGATMGAGAPPPAVAFWQYLIALLFYVPWIARLRQSVLKTHRRGLHLLRVAAAAIGVQLWVAGLAHVPIWQAIALIMLSPFFVTLGAGLILRETVGPARWVAVILGIFGGAIILEPWSDRFQITALLPVGAATFWAAHSLITKHLTATERTETLTIHLLLSLTPINAALVLLASLGSGPDGLDAGFALPIGALWIVVAAGVLTSVAQHLLVRAYSQADAAFLQPFDHLKLPLNVALGFVVFGFLPGGSMWLGSAVIVSASLYLLRNEAGTIQPA